MKADISDPTVVTELCDRIASGLSVIEVCAAPDMPSARNVYTRMSKDEQFRTSIARAREAQQEFEADAMVEMADKATVEDHQVVKLRIWARQWRASKLAPKRFGEKITAELSDPDGKPLGTGAAESAARAAFLLRKGLKEKSKGG